MSSPCTGQCVFDYEHGHCLGCCRSLEEISGWSKLSEDERNKILIRIRGE